MLHINYICSIEFIKNLRYELIMTFTCIEFSVEGKLEFPNVGSWKLSLSFIFELNGVILFTFKEFKNLLSFFELLFSEFLLFKWKSSIFLILVVKAPYKFLGL